MKQRTRPMHGGDDLVIQAMNKKTDGDLNGEIPLHKMKHQEHFIEAQVQEGDTLQAIALRFYCTISELKRINHIHKDNEIFARRTIKVPVTPYSVLTELLPTQSEPSTSSQTPKPSSTIDVLLNNGHEQVHNVPNNNKESTDYSIDCNAVVLNSTLAPAVNPYTDADPSEPVSEDTQLLPGKQKDPVESIMVKQLTSQGADFGIKWFHLVCFMLVFGVVVPLVLIYMKTHPSLLAHPHNETVNNQTEEHVRAPLEQPYSS